MVCLLYRVLQTHFARVHPKRHGGAGRACPIGMQLSYFRRTRTGRARVEVTDIKLGSRLSSVQVRMFQARGVNDGTQEEEVIGGYVTVCDLEAEGRGSEMGPVMAIPFTHQSISVPPKADFAALASPAATDGHWTRLRSLFVENISVMHNIEFYVRPSEVSRLLGSKFGVLQQWCRFAPYGMNEKGENTHQSVGRWRTSDGSVCILSDVFPELLELLTTRPFVGEENSNEMKGFFWFPTVSLNLDIKKALPQEGVEWLYSQIEVRKVQGGRFDVQLVLLDTEGDVVALSNQIALIVGMERNMKPQGKI